MTVVNRFALGWLPMLACGRNIGRGSRGLGWSAEAMLQGSGALANALSDASQIPWPSTSRPSSSTACCAPGQ